jgi:hypothetical protein
LPHDVIVAIAPLNVTVLVPWVAPKFDPEIVAAVPVTPEGGDMPVMEGGGVTVKVVPALGTLETLTITGPLVVPLATTTTIFVEVQLVTDGAKPLNVIVLVPWLEPKFVPVTVTVAPTAPAVGARLEIVGVGSTVKLDPALLTPLAWTTTFPVVAPVGTVVAMLVALQVPIVATFPLLKVTVPVPWVATKPVPEIVTDIPIPAELGEKPVMLGAATTVKLIPLLAFPETVTTIFPLVAPEGTVVTMLVVLQLVAVAAVPLNLIVLVPWVDPNVVPVKVTEAPTAPVEVERLVMFGITVKLFPLLAWLDTVTTTFPVVAAEGTVTAMLVELHVVTVADVPLKLTVLVPCDEPKVVPVIVMDAPTTPDVAERLVMFGTTVKLLPLLATPDTVTTTLPVVAAEGTVTKMLVDPHVVTVAAVPLNFTVLLPWGDPKFVPVIVTEVPTGPEVTERLVMLGDAARTGAIETNRIEHRRTTSGFHNFKIIAAPSEAPQNSLGSRPDYSSQ